MTCTGCNEPHTKRELVDGKCVRCWARQHDALADTSKTIIDRLEREVKHLEHRVDEAVNSSCSCGGKGPDDDCCPACEVWHRFKHATR